MLGDTVMCLPALEMARELWPDAKLYAIVTPRIKEMLAGVTYIDEFLIGTGDPLSIRRREKTDETRAMLSAYKFDVSILLGGDQYGPLFYQLGVPVRVGPKECVYKPLFTHPYTIGDANGWGPNERLGAIRSLGYEVPVKFPRLEVSPQARDDFNKWREMAGLREGEPFNVIHPFGSEPRKWWPHYRVPRLAGQIYKETGARSLIVGGPESREIAKTMSYSPGLISGIGGSELSISQMLAAIESAQLVITTDSAPYHMAGALGRPLIGLFPALRSQHSSRYPQGHAILGRDPSCEEHCRYGRCQSQPCRQLSNISVGEIRRLVKKALNHARLSSFAAILRSGEQQP